MLMSMLSYAATIFLTHHAASLIQLTAHRFLGHRTGGGHISRVHAYEHHGVYSKDRMISERYLDEARSVDYYYAIPALLVAVSAYAVLPLDLLVTHLVTLGFSTFAHFYLHVQYHLRNTWLNRYAWFQRKQRLHLLHHRNMSRNYAVIEFVWDRLLGTFQDMPAAR